jgi:hypothetical protein
VWEVVEVSIEYEIAVGSGVECAGGGDVGGEDDGEISCREVLGAIKRSIAPRRPLVVCNSMNGQIQEIGGIFAVVRAGCVCIVCISTSLGRSRERSLLTAKIGGKL